MIQIQTENRITTLTLNRPEKRNALNDEMAGAILQALRDLKNDDNTKVLVIAGSGDAFCAGADLSYLQKLQGNSYEDNLKDSQSLMEMFKELYLFPKVTISKVRGAAFAGGCGLAGLCDFCFASENAKFSYTEVKIGFIPAIVSVFLASRIGENNARRMLLAAEVLDAYKAKETGFVSDLFPDNELDASVEHFAAGIVSGTSAQSIAATKQLLAGFSGKGLTEKLQMAAEANAMARSSDDCKRGIAAFLNKEKLSW